MSLIANPLEQVTPSELRARTSLKWRAYPEDVLPLWVAEMDVRLAEPVREAIEAAVRDGDTGYPVGTGYAEALAEFAERRWSWPGMAVERTVLVADVMTGLMEMVALVTAPGDAVVVNPPVYPPFYGFLTKADRRVVEAPLGPDGRLDLDAVERAFVEHKPAAHLLCNPQNPTGTVHTAAELGALAALARTHGVRIVADEIHAPLVLPGATFTPVLSVPGAENAFSVMSASKAWNLAGLKSAVAVAGPEAAADLARVPEVVGHGASHLGAIAHTAALRAGTPWLDALLAGLAENRRLLGELFAARLPHLSWTPPEGTYLAWIDCRADRSTPTTAPAERYLADARVALMAGEEFGTGGAGHVRLNFATSATVLREAVDRMAPAP